MNSTNLYCPNCEANQHREWLLFDADNDRYYCAHCRCWYTRDQLRQPYTAKAERLEADAAFVRDMLDQICLISCPYNNPIPKHL